jgi:hypothetical protein
MSLPSSTKKRKGGKRPAKVKSKARKEKLPPEAYRKPRANLFTMLLVLSLVAIIMSCVFLYYHMQMYDMRLNPPTAAWSGGGQGTVVSG